MKVEIKNLKPGDVVTRLPYAGSEKLPLTVVYVLQARQSGYRILRGVDATGRTIDVPVGHFSNRVEVAR
jgi:hypothetical protein